MTFWIRRPGLSRTGTERRPRCSVRLDGTLSDAVLSGDATHAVPIAPPRRTHDFGVQGLALMAGSAVSSFAVVWVLFFQLTLLSGAFGFLICWYVCSSRCSGW